MDNALPEMLVSKLDVYRVLFDICQRIDECQCNFVRTDALVSITFLFFLIFFFNSLSHVNSNKTNKNLITIFLADKESRGKKCDTHCALEKFVNDVITDPFVAKEIDFRQFYPMILYATQLCYVYDSIWLRSHGTI